MQTNREKDIYSCLVCGSASSQCSKLKRHKKMHTGEKSFSCQVCGATFLNNSTLKIHLRTHTERNHLLVKYMVQHFHRIQN